MRALIFMPILLLLAACSAPLGGDGSGVVLVNRTDNALLYVAADLENAPLLDPNPAIDPREAPERLVAAGDQLAIEIAEYSGTGVLLFLYEIPAQDYAGPVPLTRTLRISAAELARAQGRIVIKDE